MAHLRILGMNLGTETATGRTMLQVLGAVAEHARAPMLERQREGIAKAEGKYKGRAKNRDGQGRRGRETAGPVLSIYFLYQRERIPPKVRARPW